MTRAVFAIPGDLATRTGGYIYDRRVMELLPLHGIDVAHCGLPASFPFPDAQDIARTRSLLDAIPAGDVIVADGLFWGAVPAEIAASIAAKIIALCHHPLGLEAGLDAAQANALMRNERATLAIAAHVVVTSAETARTLVQDFAVPESKITIAEPGADRAERARGSGGDPVLLAVGSLVPRKGHDVLVEALALLAGLDWRCTIIGSPDRAPAHAAEIRARIAASGLEKRIELAGELDGEGLARAYDSSDIFVSASHYEGYGMVLTEALARGLPIVTTTGGAAATTAPDAAALKVPPADAPALAHALRTLIEDRPLRRRLSDAAFAASGTLPRWEDAAARMAQVIRAVAAGAREDTSI